jgi:hypothetical protein
MKKERRCAECQQTHPASQDWQYAVPDGVRYPAGIAFLWTLGLIAFVLWNGTTGAEPDLFACLSVLAIFTGATAFSLHRPRRFHWPPPPSP